MEANGAARSASVSQQHWFTLLVLSVQRSMISRHTCAQSHPLFQRPRSPDEAFVFIRILVAGPVIIHFSTASGTMILILGRLRV